MFRSHILTVSFLCAPLALSAQEASKETEKAQFKPFTGRVSGNKVRMRAKPALDAPIVKELRSGDLYIITGENDEFYSMPATKDIRAYVHRKFIIDGAIDGSKVNVRLSPTTDAPVIAQLNTGDKVQGKVSAEDPKWLEIDTPDYVQFYVAKDYVENIGGPEVLLRLQKKTERVNKLLAEAKKGIAEQLAKPYESIDLDEHLQDLTEVSREIEEFPAQAQEARQLIRQTNDTFLQKKIKYLESLTQNSKENWSRKSDELRKEISEQTKRMEELEAKYSLEPQAKPAPVVAAPAPAPASPKTAEMLAWEPVENELYQKWARHQTGNPTLDEFYRRQSDSGRTLRGILAPYNHSVKGRPGDYVLLTETSKTPAAYLYSTKVNLADHLGQPVTLRVVERSNRNFAFPAYYVLYMEQ
ncbi:MAG: hypothetical protein KDK48_03895 [Chlamydiia bacterium]|nr:hypothetical protein [Chlamydiia bacterium]